MHGTKDRQINYFIIQMYYFTQYLNVTNEFTVTFPVISTTWQIILKILLERISIFVSSYSEKVLEYKYL